MKLKIGVGLVVLIILVFTVFGDNGLISLVRDKRHEKSLVQEKERIEKENKELRQEIERLKNDPSYVERLAREELGMVKEGEIVYMFPDDEGDGPDGQ